MLGCFGKGAVPHYTQKHRKLPQLHARPSSSLFSSVSHLPTGLSRMYYDSLYVPLFLLINDIGLPPERERII